VSTHYTRTARVLHWLMAALLIPMLLLGEETMGSHDARFLPTLHASAGFSLLVLLVIRVWWRWKHLPPQLMHKSAWETVAAKASHAMLYLAMALLPLTGWLAYTEHVRRSLGMRPASLFGFRIPLLPDFGINWHLIHNWGGKLVLALIVVHMAAAVKHHFYDRDETLRRMLR
jgi:cytochrome b561